MSPKPGEPSSIGPTAVMSARDCPTCQKANHPAAMLCATCGAPLVPGARSGWSEVGGDPGASTSRSLGGAITDPDPTQSRPLVDHLGSSGELLPPVADPLIGVVVAERYRIVELLGRGGMGIVYKVEHTRIGKLLAMKLLTGELSRNPEVVRRFKQEALTVSRLSSPNTVQVFDFGAAEGLTYLVMELVSGEDLARVLRAHGPMPFTRLGKIMIQVSSSLAEAHQKGIVHRDVKPENVMLLRARDGSDVAKVLDFGLAKLREGSELNDVTSQGAIVGTPYFMAPEQIRGETVDARTDIYALGALMYRALTGHYPFIGNTPLAVFTRHLTQAPPPFAERSPSVSVPAGVEALVLKALAKDPNERFQKVEELQAALVAEVRSAGTSSVDSLLDSGQIRRLERAAVPSPAPGAAVVPEIATRDEVERYERKLRRLRWGAYGSAMVVALAAAAGAFKLWAFRSAPTFSGLEGEPNNTAGEANPLPLGQTIRAHLGPRLDATHGDRDFFSFEVKGSAGQAEETIALEVTSLPNFAMCTLLYRPGLSTALGQYCVGRPGRGLSIPALRLAPGKYLLSVMQDMEGYGGSSPFIHENVSDLYTVTVGLTSPKAGAEVEPNDAVASSNPIAPGGAMTGTLGWARDEDVFCVAASEAKSIRWKVKDVVREAGSVLEATPFLGAVPSPAVRIHTRAGAASPTDVETPWTSEPVAPAAPGEPRCLRLRLAVDPWAVDPSPVVPRGGSEAYAVEVEIAP